ncbi:MAG: glycosyltransferase family 4 protein [Pseudomonadales bacterium]|nr:glycosyltransferase family 4 protein [Pseudomonadales bacterium]
MRVLVVGNGNIAIDNGKARVNSNTADFCSELADFGYHVSYLQFSKVSEHNDNLLTGEFRREVAVYQVQLRDGLSKIVSYLKMALKFIAILPRFDFVYIFFPGHLPILVGNACILMGIPYGLYLRGEVGLDASASRRLFRKARFVLTVSELLKQRIETTNKMVEVIAPMIPFTKKDIVKDREYLPEAVMRCLYVGRLEKRKGSLELISAIDKLLAKTEAIAFNIVGGGDLYSKVSAKYINEPRVTVHGVISDPARLMGVYRDNDVFVFPSHDEGFPRVLYEAMLARLTIVTTMVGGIGGLMSDGENCLEINVEDVESLVSSLEKLADDNVLRERLASNGSSTIVNVLSGNRQKHSELIVKYLKDSVVA